MAGWLGQPTWGSLQGADQDSDHSDEAGIARQVLPIASKTRAWVDSITCLFLCVYLVSPHFSWSFTLDSRRFACIYLIELVLPES